MLAPAVGVCLLILGVIAHFVAQPAYVVMGMLPAGGILTVIFSVLLPLVIREHRAAGHRKMTAQDL